MKKFRQSLSVTAATLGILSIVSTNPALAALFNLGFCGQFLNLDDTPITPDTEVFEAPLDPLPNNPQNRVLPSYITVESAETNDAGENYGIKDAKIETQRVDLTPSLISYNFSNLMSSALNGGIVTWTFVDSAGNEFDVNVPQLILNDLPNLVGNNLDITNIERRVGSNPTKDPDAVRITPVPEPTSIIGTVITLGLGGILTKKNLKKLNEKKESA